ncbi:MAG: 50S ribosomal protein L9 [Sphaerochaetaceae bacterium]
MKIILNQDVQNLGEEGDVVEVKNGYARNFLLPNGYAVLFNKTNQSIFTSRAAAIEKRKTEKRQAAASLKEKLDATTITLIVSAGDSGKLFGSVTNVMVQEALAKQGLDIDRKRIEVATHAIKNVGTYTVRIRLYENENAQVKVVVLSEIEMKRAASAKAAADKAAEKAAAKAANASAGTVEKEPVVEEAWGAEGIQEEEDDDSSDK